MFLITGVLDCRKAATHDNEIRYLYEEMEAQIKTEKDRLLLKVRLFHLKSQIFFTCYPFNPAVFHPLNPLLTFQDSEHLQLRSQDLQHQLFSKEKELEHLFQKQKRVSARTQH